MSAAVLREAAKLMRERAEAARSSAAPQWDDIGNIERDADWYMPLALSSRNVASAADSEHIASWSPIVAMAVAEWLAFEADTCEAAGENRQTEHALAVARAYLGSDQ